MGREYYIINKGCLVLIFYYIIIKKKSINRIWLKILYVNVFVDWFVYVFFFVGDLGDGEEVDFCLLWLVWLFYFLFY